QLLAGGLSMVAVSFAWYSTMMLLPAADRPWVGDTTDDSWFSLIFGANGLGRVSGEGGGASPGGGGGSGAGANFGGAAGPLRLFNSIVGGQIAWLVPLAVLGLVLGLWTSRRALRTDLRRCAYLLWGGWAVVSWAVFSFSKGIFHPYYTTALAPAVAVLAAGGLVALWDRSRRSTGWAAALAAALAGTALLSYALLGRTAGFAPHLGSAVLALAAVAVGCLLLARIAPIAASGFGRGRLAWLAAVAGLVAVLAGPAAYSIATVGKPLSGGNPLAGPASAGTGFGGGSIGGPGGGSQPRRGGSFTSAAAGGPPPGTAGGSFGYGPPPAGAGAGGSGLPGSLGGVPSGRLSGGPGRAGAGLAQAGPGGAAVSKALVNYLEATNTVPPIWSRRSDPAPPAISRSRAPATSSTWAASWARIPPRVLLS
ncbi:MAG TPA: hypothetical protein VK781_01705, partial [Solirubrobacteraceae bacterium]|nr:hypothetical protein [Solirubrobacteraceae bacterium]